MIRSLTFAVLFSPLTASAIGQSADGVLMVQRATAEGVPLTKRVSIQSTRMRIEVTSPSGVKQVVIFDSGKQVVDIVDPAQKTYVEITKADVDRMKQFVQGGMAQAQAHPEQLPPEQRAQLEAMMKARGGAAAALQYTRTGTDTVGSWPCVKYDLMQNGQKIGDVCTVNPSTLGFGATDLDVLRQMSEFFSAMGPHMASPLQGVSPVDQLVNSGFPVKTEMMVQGHTTTMEVVEVKRQTFSDSSFAVPAGFTKQDIMGAMGRHG